MIFRNYDTTDLAEIAELERRAFPIGPYTKTMLKRVFSIRESFSYIAEENGRIAGYIVALPLDTESADVESVAVHPDFQRRGLGGQLMEMIELEMRRRGFNYSILEVRDMNDEAIRFYRRLDYQISTHMPRYYTEIFRGSRGAYRMIKRLQSDSNEKEHS